MIGSRYVPMSLSLQAKQDHIPFTMDRRDTEIRELTFRTTNLSISIPLSLLVRIVKAQERLSELPLL